MKQIIKRTIYAICILLTCVIFNGALAQKQLSEKQVMKNKHIDFSKEVIHFELSGLIEIDGHTFLNDTCKVKIIYIANLEGISILNEKTKQKYTLRKCGREGCRIIHLVKDNPIQDLIISPQWGGNLYLNNRNTTPAVILD